MSRVRNFGIVALAVVAAFAIAQDSFKLRRTPKVGHEVVMKLSAEVDVMGMSASFSAKIKEKVIRVDENGDYTIESSQSEGKVKLADQEMDAPDGGATTTKYSAAGQILEMKGEDVTDDAYRLANMNSWVFEDRTYKTGDVIKVNNKPSKLNGNVSSEATLTVGAVETVGKFTTVKLTFSYKETSGDAPAEASGTAWVDTSDGSLVKMVGEYKNAPFPGAPAPINAKMMMERI